MCVCVCLSVCLFKLQFVVPEGIRDLTCTRADVAKSHGFPSYIKLSITLDAF